MSKYYEKCHRFIFSQKINHALTLNEEHKIIRNQHILSLRFPSSDCCTTTSSRLLRRVVGFTACHKIRGLSWL